MPLYDRKQGSWCRRIGGVVVPSGGRSNWLLPLNTVECLGSEDTFSSFFDVDWTVGTAAQMIAFAVFTADIVLVIGIEGWF